MTATGRTMPRCSLHHTWLVCARLSPAHAAALGQLSGKLPDTLRKPR